MTIVDVNVLLYAINSAEPHHPSARAWLEEALSGGETVGLTWATLLAFLRLATHPSVFERPLSIEEATSHLDVWLSQPSAVLVGPTSRLHLSLMRSLLDTTGSAGNLVADAHLAALALELKATITSYDGDFRRFPGVRLVTPSSPGERG